MAAFYPSPESDPTPLYFAIPDGQTAPVLARTPIVVRLLAVAVAVAAVAGRAESAEFDACRLDAGPRVATLAAECLELPVAENPAEPDGGEIRLFVAKAASLSVEPMPDPLIVLSGGPGQSAIDFYLSYRGAFERIRETRDILLIDQRGTGRSNPLDCDDGESLLEGAEDLSTVRAATERCIAALPGDARFYTTSVAVGDLVRVFDALDIAAVNLYGISYGTRVAQQLMRRHPERVRRVILDGVVPMPLVLGPSIALDAQAALERMLGRCGEEPVCRERFPQPLDDLKALATKLDAAPVDVVVDDPVSGERRIQTLSDAELAVAVRLMSYAPATAALLPLYIDAALNAERYQPLAAQVLMIERMLLGGLSIGMHNSVVCTEDAPWFDESAIDRAALAATYLGSMTFDAIDAACDVWPRGVIDDDFKEPLISDIPTLLLSGENDPITPPAFGDEVASGLSASLHLVGPAQGHGLAPHGCAPRVMAEFLEADDPLAIDGSCIGALTPMPFFVDFTGPAQ